MRSRWIIVLASAFFGIAAAPPDAYVPTTLTPEQVFAKAQAARGHLRAGAYHIVSRIERRDGTVDVDEYQDGDETLMREREGSFSWASGTHAGVHWEQDENGGVSIASDYEDTENPFSRAVSIASVHDDGATRVLGLTKTQPQSIVVQVVPGAGLTQRRYYDAATFLLQRVETTDYDGKTWSYSYSDYKTMFGAAFAQSIAYDDGFAENASTTRLVGITPISSMPSTAMPKSTPLFDLRDRRRVRLPADFTPDGIVVPIMIGGRRLDFELDSGADSIVLSDAVARQLGLSVTSRHKASFDEDFSFGRSRLDDVALGDLHARNVTITVAPISNDLGDRKIVGLLGGDFFLTQRVWVDFKNKSLELVGPSFAPPSAASAIEIQVDDRVPRAHVQFNGVAGAFMVDLGADETMMYEHFFRNFHPKTTGDVIGIVRGIGGEQASYHQYTFSRFDFGDQSFADASVIVAFGSKFEDIDYDGLIGRNILDNFNLLFDYGARKLYAQSLL